MNPALRVLFVLLGLGDFWFSSYFAYMYVTTNPRDSVEKRMRRMLAIACCLLIITGLILILQAMVLVEAMVV